MKQRILTFCVIFLTFTSIVSAAAIKDFVIEADNLSYNEDGTIIEARGNVFASHKDLSIKTQNLTYHVDKGEVSVWDGFEMDIKDGMHLVGDSLEYDLKMKKGDAKNVRIDFEESVMAGKDVYLATEEVKLKSAYFTGCTDEDPHYHITASRLILYPEEGWLICYFGYFWFYGVPILPMPAYIFDLKESRAGGIRTKNYAPIPEYGYNEEDGHYVNLRFAWFANKKLYGNYLLTWAENNKLGTGIECRYFYNENNDGDIRVYYDARNKIYGGLTHVYSFGPAMDEGKKYFFGLFNLKQRLMFDFITNFSYRERINFERVTVLPDLTLKLNSFPILIDRLTFDTSITYGVVSEESSVKTGRGIYRAGLNYGIPTDFGLFGLGIGLNNSWYEDYSVWNRVSQLTSYSNSWGDFDGYLGHLHYLNFSGNSPFNFENYHLKPSDEINTRLMYNFYVHKIGIDYIHYVPSGDPRELDYITLIGMHCYNIEFRYRAMREEFLFGFSIF